MSGLRLTHHPSLAKMAEDAPSEEEVKKGKGRNGQRQKNTGSRARDNIWKQRVPTIRKGQRGRDGDPGTLSGGAKKS